MIHGQSIRTPPPSSAGQNPPAGAVLAAAPLGAEAVYNGSTAYPPPWPATSTEIMHARYFSPNLGRFVSVDPVGGEVGSSQSWNRYSYVENNPLTKIDPDGKADQVVLDYYYATKDLGPEAKEAFDSGLQTSLAVGLGSLAVGALACEAVPALVTYSLTPQGQQMAAEILEAVGPNPATGAIRSEYIKRSEALVGAAGLMLKGGATAEDAARTLVPVRNELKAAARQAGPWWAARLADVRNLVKYGDRLGPTADQLFEQYGSWEKVIEHLGVTSETWNRLAN